MAAGSDACQAWAPKPSRTLPPAPPNPLPHDGSHGLGGQQLVQAKVVDLDLAVPQNCARTEQELRKRCRLRRAAPGHRLKEVQMAKQSLLEDHLRHQSGVCFSLFFRFWCLERLFGHAVPMVLGGFRLYFPDFLVLVLGKVVRECFPHKACGLEWFRI